MQFPVFLKLGPLTLHPHVAFESLAYIIALTVYFGTLRGKGALSQTADWNVQAWLLASAVLGALVGAVVMGSLDNGFSFSALTDQRQELRAGKSLVGGIFGGWAGIAVFKVIMGITSSTGDNWVIPICIGIMIGRVGCFLTGLADGTHGLPTTLPWGVNFGDGIPRHPTQLYEIAFLACILPFLIKQQYSRLIAGRSFRLFVIAYAGWRFLIEELKPTPEITLGLTFIQIACLLMFVIMLLRLRSYGISRESGSL